MNHRESSLLAPCSKEEAKILQLKTSLSMMAKCFKDQDPMRRLMFRDLNQMRKKKKKRKKK